MPPLLHLYIYMKLLTNGLWPEKWEWVGEGGGAGVTNRWFGHFVYGFLSLAVSKCVVANIGFVRKYYYLTY